MTERKKMFPDGEPDPYDRIAALEVRVGVQLQAIRTLRNCLDEIMTRIATDEGVPVQPSIGEMRFIYAMIKGTINAIEMMPRDR